MRIVHPHFLNFSSSSFCNWKKKSGFCLNFSIEFGLANDLLIKSKVHCQVLFLFDIPGTSQCVTLFQELTIFLPSILPSFIFHNLGALGVLPNSLAALVQPPLMATVLPNLLMLTFPQAQMLASFFLYTLSTACHGFGKISTCQQHSNLNSNLNFSSELHLIYIASYVLVISTWLSSRHLKLWVFHYAYILLFTFPLAFISYLIYKKFLILPPEYLFGYHMAINVKNK